jgi:cell division protein FtsI/penicillin-binding protein 2
MNPRTGEILAYAVAPSYDPNNFRKATPLQMKNWTLTDVFPPGSTFKIITLASAFELGKIDETTKVLDTGKMKIGDWEIQNYDYTARPYPGEITLEYLLEHSSNIGSVKVAEKMSSKEFYDMLKKFGFGTKSGVDLPGESSGLLPAWQNWDKSMHASMSYGYGTSISTMQFVSAVAALANGGVRVTPHVIKYDEDEAKKKIKSVQVCSPATAQKVTKLLADSINNGKSNVRLASYNVAAKTGTSRKPKENGKGYTDALYTSTIGYFPADDPQILIYVMIDSARGGGVWGNTIAAPVFYEVATQSARILNLKPDKELDTKPKN